MEFKILARIKNKSFEPMDDSLPSPRLQPFRIFELKHRNSLKLNFEKYEGDLCFIVVRDADRPERSPLVSAIIAKGYNWPLTVNRKNLGEVKNICIEVSDPVGLRLRISERTLLNRLGEIIVAQGQNSRDLLQNYLTKRRPDFAKWYRRYHSLSRQEHHLWQHLARSQISNLDIKLWLLNGSPEELASFNKLLTPLPFKSTRIVPINQFIDMCNAPPADFHLVLEGGSKPWFLAPLLLALWYKQHVHNAMVFGDSEVINSQGQLAPQFFARFDDLAMEENGTLPCLGIAGFNHEAILMAKSATTLAQAALLLARQNQRPIHLPAILSEVPAWKAPARKVKPTSANNSTICATPLISCIIPSRDNPLLLERAVRSISQTTLGLNLEFIVVDHASEKIETARTLEQLTKEFSIKIVRAEGEFNFSYLMNLGRSAASGEILISINDDIEAIVPHWLEPIIALVQRPDIGCVGPLLLFPDQLIQHAGVVVGFGGLADHIGRLRLWNDPDLPWILTHNRSVEVVTGAYLAVRAQIWDEVKGWNEQLSVEFNDVEFCLKVQRLGLRNCYCAQSVLVHHESISRGKPQKSKQWPRMQRDRNRFVAENWPDLLLDRYFSSNWSLRNTKMSLAHPPRHPPLAQLPYYPGD